MSQSGIKKIYAPQRATSFIGGICKWWYVPVHAILSFPKIDRVAQRYEEEPQLLPGYSWIGPIKVPDSKLGFTESQETGKPGHWLKQSVTAYQPGETPDNRILRQNMMFGEYVVVAKLRAGSGYLLIGTDKSGLSYDHAFASGKGGLKADAGVDFTLSGESPYNAPGLPSFSGDAGSLAGLPNRFYWGTLPTNRLPTSAEIEAAASAVFPNGGNTKADFTGDLVPKWRFAAELVSEPVKTRQHVNALSSGPIGAIGSFETWINRGTVLRPAGGSYRVYLTGFQTTFFLQQVEFII